MRGMRYQMPALGQQCSNAPAKVDAEDSLMLQDTRQLRHQAAGQARAPVRGRDRHGRDVAVPVLGAALRLTENIRGGGGGAASTLLAAVAVRVALAVSVAASCPPRPRTRSLQLSTRL